MKITQIFIATSIKVFEAFDVATLPINVVPPYLFTELFTKTRDIISIF